MNAPAARPVKAMLIAACLATSCQDFEAETFTGVLEFLTPPGAITAGDTIQYRAYAQYENSELLLVRFKSEQYPEAWEWKSSDPAIATVSSTGVVRAVAPGPFRISATFQKGLAAVERDLTVTATVDSVVLSPAVDTVDLNGSITVDATARDAQGQGLRWVPFAAKVMAAAAQISVTSQAISETTTRFTVRATGGVLVPVVISAPNVRPERTRSATFTLYVNP